MKKSSQTVYAHSSEFLQKRRALFPSNEKINDNDLGNITPLNYDSNSNDDNINQLIFDNNKSINDYDIIGVVDNSLDTNKTILCSSPLIDITKKTDPETFLNTPLQESPSHSQQTPIDNTINNTTCNLPRLIRKSLLTTAVNDYSLNTDRNMSPLTHYSQSMNNKNSKVRTALFPEIPPKSFYPKPENNHTTTTTTNKNEKNNSLKLERRKPSLRKQTQYLCNRNWKNRSKRQSGQINAGVRHNIRKKKLKKKLNNSKIIEAALNIMENSPLNEYLEELEKLKDNNQPKKLIENPGIVEKKESNERKRPHSPVQESTRKFFKSSRDENEITKQNKLVTKCTNDENFDFSFITADDEPSLTDKQLNNIINSLEDEKENRILPSEINETNSSKLPVMNKENQVNNILLSPTSQMCDMASGLALNSPKRVQNLSNILTKVPTNSGEQKWFPVFYSNYTSNNKGNGEEKPKNSLENNIITKKFKQLSKNQMLLDAGQKKFGVTQCNECQFVYHLGDPSDEIVHLNYHNAVPVLRFHGWKNERIVYDNFGNGRIIQIIPTDSKPWWKRVKDVLEVVNRDLGHYDLQTSYDYCQVFLYIKNKSIVGVLVAEEKSVAHKLLTTAANQVDLCSEESFRVKCGISRIWVSQTHRKQGIATCLLNCLKKHFIFGYIMNNEDIAFSSPTEAGKMFGKNYFKTSNFLIYYA